uniref:Aminotransferase-like plant mobile domain-containing protein n=1 Tax=Fagus sylvatica TaxID=28930 RepID=A0A2N9GIS5_FAGSY
MASSSSHPPPDTAMASGGDSEIPTADAGTMDTGSVGDESVDGSRFSPVPEDDREDFVFPLLDPWYDNGGNFPYIPNKVSLPPSNWEWMLRGQEATADQVWVPPLSSISDLKIQRGDMQPVPIDFEFPCSAAADWFHWVADEFLDVKFCGGGVLLHTRSFFSWGELTITLEDVENHWLLPVLGDMDPFAVEMSEEETLVEQALMARASTRINAWSVYFAKGTEPAIRRAAFVAYWLYSICLDEVRGGSCHFYYYLLQYFRTADLPLGTLSELPRELLCRGKDPDLVPSLDFEECILWRPYSYRYADFSCHSVLYWFSDIASQSFELSPDDTRSLTYLSAVNPGWLPVWSDKGVEYTHYCPNRVRRQFGLDQSVPGSPSETLPRTPSIAPFLNDHAFDYWSQSVSRMVIPCGGKAWHMHCGDAGVLAQGGCCYGRLCQTRQRDQGSFAQSPCTSYGDHDSISPYPNRNFLCREAGLGLCRMGWGKGGKKIDSGKGASSPAASKQKPKSAAKTSSKRPKVAMDMSMIPPSELGDRALMAPETESSAIQEKSAPPSTKAKSQPRSKSVAVKKAKSKPTQKSAVAPPSSGEEPPAESATPIEKESAVPTPPSTMYGRTRSKRKAAEEQVKSQAKRRVGDEGEGSDQAPIVIEEVSGGDDVVDAGVGTTEVNESIVERQEVALKSTDDVAAKDSPIDWTDSDDAMADEALGVTVSDEAVLVMADEAVQSTTSIMAEEAPGEIPVSMADVVPEAHEVTPVMADETLVGMADETLAGSAAEEDQDIDSVDSEETIADEPQPLQIVPFADQRDEPRTIDPIEEESSPMVVSDRPSSGTFIGGQVPALEGTSIQDADDGGMADTEVRGVDVVPEDVEAPVLCGEGERCSCSVCGSQFLSDAVCSRGPLVAYGNFWVYQDAVPLLQGLSAKFGDFTTHFKFGAGFGGPMLSLLGSVLADMRRTSFKTLSEPKILSWRSVVQDLIAVGFDLDFMLEHLRKVARKFFGEAIASEMKIVQEQISSLQSTLAVLVSYQGELMSAAAASPEAVEVASPIDGLFD